MAPRNLWTENEMRRARQLYRTLHEYGAVARVLNRSPETVRRHLKGLEDARSERVIVRAEKAPQAVLDERNERLARSHGSLTSRFFGDPLPGYSALDQRDA